MEEILGHVGWRCAGGIDGQTLDAVEGGEQQPAGHHRLARTHRSVGHAFLDHRRDRLAERELGLARRLALVFGHLAEVGQHEAAPEILADRSEEHTSELQSLMRNSYAVFCLKKKK